MATNSPLAQRERNELFRSGDFQGEEDDEDGEEFLDPRVKGELDRLNSSTAEINRLEQDLEELHAAFRQTLTESAFVLKSQASFLGRSCVDNARPYYDALRQAKQAQTETQKAALKYEKACSSHQAAKKLLATAEQNLVSTSTEHKILDPTWQEMLNQAVIRVMDAERERTLSEREHLGTARAFSEAGRKVTELRTKLKSVISKSRPYFELKMKYDQILEAHKRQVEVTQENLLVAKREYSLALKNLEGISEEIHEMRKSRDSLDTILREREEGVGAESPAADLSCDSTRIMSSLQKLTSFSPSYGFKIALVSACRQEGDLHVTSERQGEPEGATSVDNDADEHLIHSLDTRPKDFKESVHVMDSRCSCRTAEDVKGNLAEVSVKDSLVEKEVTVNLFESDYQSGTKEDEVPSAVSGFQKESGGNYETLQQNSSSQRESLEDVSESGERNSSSTPNFNAVVDGHDDRVLECNTDDTSSNLLRDTEHEGFSSSGDWTHLQKKRTAPEVSSAFENNFANGDKGEELQLRCAAEGVVEPSEHTGIPSDKEDGILAARLPDSYLSVAEDLVSQEDSGKRTGDGDSAFENQTDALDREGLDTTDGDLTMDKTDRVLAESLPNNCSSIAKGDSAFGNHAGELDMEDNETADTDVSGNKTTVEELPDGILTAYLHSSCSSVAEDAAFENQTGVLEGIETVDRDVTGDNTTVEEVPELTANLLNNSSSVAEDAGFENQTGVLEGIETAHSDESGDNTNVEELPDGELTAYLPNNSSPAAEDHVSNQEIADGDSVLDEAFENKTDVLDTEADRDAKEDKSTFDESSS